MRVRRVTWIGFRSRFSSHLSCHHSWNLGLDPDGYFIPAVKRASLKASKKGESKGQKGESRKSRRRDTRGTGEGVFKRDRNGRIETM